MKASAASARSLAAHAVARILREGVTLDAALKDALVAADPKLAPSVRSLSYGAVRGYYRHEAILGRLLSTPVRSLDFLVRALLSVALYELEDERTPEYAVVDAAVQTAKSTDASRAAGLINAVLRRYLRERKVLDADIARNPATRHASPVWLADRLRADWPVRWTQLLAAGDAQAPMWLRVNRRHGTAADYLATLHAAGIGARAEERVPQAVLLDAPCDVQDLPGFAQGVVSVQDLGAQCVAFPLALAAGQRVLDACAAPGGKTALIAEREPDLAEVVAVDIDPLRLNRVRQNLSRGNLNATVVCGLVGWRSLRSHLARRALFGARSHPPASRHSSA
jgi:16S rRNA (cytosine967-C5)-methyltransferase